MNVILNETAWAKKMVEERSLGRKPFDTLRLVARYYLDSGYSNKDARQALDKFLVMCEPTASLTKWSQTIDAALARAAQHEAVHIDKIDITVPEMTTIRSIESKQEQRLAFTLLCLAKYWMIVNPKANGWVNNKDSDIMHLANINTSLERQSIIYRHLCDAGMIQFSRRVDNTNVRVCFAAPGATAFSITDFRNLGNQYNMYCGAKDYIKCSVCGLVVKRTGNPQKYCKECASKVQTSQIVKYIQQKRTLACK